MRNPWGRERYNGAWNDEDPQWTDDFKKQANLVVNKDDGFFHVPLEKFAQVFDGIVVVHYKDWKRSEPMDLPPKL